MTVPTTVETDPGRPADGPSTEPPFLEVNRLARSFGETRALVDCRLDIRVGEVHAVVGENGSGKSTLVKILSGVLRPGSGELRMQGRTMHFATSRQAQRAGIATVFQETLVVDELSVRDNILLGTDGVLRRGKGAIDKSAVLSAILELIGLHSIDPDVPVWRLSLGQRQLVTIARALVRPWKLLILDEATSALDVRDRDVLFDALGNLIAQGRAVLFISHRMDEVRRIAGRVTVLRSGVSMDTLVAREMPDDLLLRMVAGVKEGAKVEAADPARAIPRGESQGSSRLVMSATAVRVRDGALAFNLSVSEGEIVGVAGLEGHGQVAFLEAVAGLTRARAGEIRIHGDQPRTLHDLHDAARRGVVYVPRERNREGIFPSRDVGENLIVASLPRLAQLGVLNRARVRALVSRAMADLNVRARGDRALITQLSGGNQQKVIIGRALSLQPRLLVLNDPLRGVDHRTKQEINGILRRLCGAGMAVLFLSTEIEELLMLCQRIAVFREGSLQSLLDSDEASMERVVAAMFGRDSTKR